MASMNIETFRHEVLLPRLARIRLDYSEAVGCGWLTKKPSKRAKRLMEWLVFVEERCGIPE